MAFCVSLCLVPRALVVGAVRSGWDLEVLLKQTLKGMNTLKVFCPNNFVDDDDDG
jgi:hypothetical protein